MDYQTIPSATTLGFGEGLSEIIKSSYKLPFHCQIQDNDKLDLQNKLLSLFANNNVWRKDTVGGEKKSW